MPTIVKKECTKKISSKQMDAQMIGINVIWSSIQKLVDFTLNTKYTKNLHENRFKTQQHLGIHQNKWMPKGLGLMLFGHPYKSWLILY
jgi:mannose/fructose/N-acetylgalactosamine-specific phosphotransferase system component IID